MLPHIWFDADYCHRNEFGIYVIKDENLQDPCKHEHLSVTEKKILKNNFDWFWKPASWLSEGFLQLLILACKGEVPQEECWNQVSQLCANIIL